MLLGGLKLLSGATILFRREKDILQLRLRKLTYFMSFGNMCGDCVPFHKTQITQFGFLRTPEDHHLDWEWGLIHSFSPGCSSNHQHFTCSSIPLELFDHQCNQVGGLINKLDAITWLTACYKDVRCFDLTSRSQLSLHLESLICNLKLWPHWLLEVVYLVRKRRTDRGK